MPNRARTVARTCALFFTLLGSALAAEACHGPPGDCRYDPHCGGGIGGFCDDDRDCADGHCCDSKNCGGGMCTYHCDNDRDCPSDMGCEHDTCFFLCDNDRDCADGATCEHGKTVCEWD